MVKCEACYFFDCGIGCRCECHKKELTFECNSNDSEQSGLAVLFG